MKFLGKLILWLLVALLLVIIGAWFLLQTHWGARQASALAQQWHRLAGLLR